MPPGWGPTAGNAALDNAFTAYKWMQLHTGQPGPNGTSNVAANAVRQQVAMAAAAGGSIASNVNVDWTAVAGSETYTHCTFWTLNAGGVFGFSGTVVANPITAGDNFRIPAGQLVASVTLAS